MLRILVADDDPVSRRLMERLLERAGYEVVLAEDGRQALQILLDEDGPRLALLDWMMPELDGPSVCAEIRSRRERSYTHITLLTSKEAKEDLVAGLHSGADDYLTKPCNFEELKARLRTGVRILRLEDKLVEAREEMRFRATHDPLTLLWNRGAILAQAKDEMSRSRQERSYCSLLLCDADNFKQINDVYGHLIGDAVLREIAAKLTNSIRPDDFVGRYGGEEFLVILRDCGPESLLRRGDQIRESIASHLFTGNLGHLSISISVGAVCVDEDSDVHDLEALLSRADAALYRAKLEGRNRVVIFGQEPGKTPDLNAIPDPILR
jgi:two-component system, cell cycle response regulator